MTSIRELRARNEEGRMKYMLLMQRPQSGFEEMRAMAPEEMKAHGEYMMAMDEELRKSGEHVDGQGLSGPEQAIIVRAQDDGPPVVSDGPFPEAKEFLAGYWIIDVESRERAIEIAAKASAAPGRGGAPVKTPFEVRALMSASADEM
jgi:hypothetical protein